mmetsp:Transcript_29938/g.61189  ORF Transcript_29938/g.61189 Transcript_29938/m.61189 type:complete len:186 (+) Transcript_29938:62-619(+)
MKHSTSLPAFTRSEDWSHLKLKKRRMPSPKSVTSFVLDLSSLDTTRFLLLKPETPPKVSHRVIDIDFILGDFVTSSFNNDTLLEVRSATEVASRNQQFSKKRRRFEPAEDVASFLNSETAAWNHLLPAGQVAKIEDVEKAGCFLGLGTSNTMHISNVISLEISSWNKVYQKSAAAMEHTMESCIL